MCVCVCHLRTYILPPIHSHSSTPTPPLPPLHSHPSISLDPDVSGSCLSVPLEPEISVVDLQAKCQKLQKEVTEVREWMTRNCKAKHLLQH